MCKHNPEAIGRSGRLLAGVLVAAAVVWSCSDDTEADPCESLNPPPSCQAVNNTNKTNSLNMV